MHPNSEICIIQRKTYRMRRGIRNKCYIQCFLSFKKPVPYFDPGLTQSVTELNKLLIHLLLFKLFYFILHKIKFKLFLTTMIV